MYTLLLEKGPYAVADVGGKASALSYLVSHGIEVPPGFVVTTEAYQKFIDENHIDRAAPDAREAIADGIMPSRVEASIVTALARFGADARFAVRSSAIFEDMADASFAGQYDTFLDIPKDQVLDAIQRCWASSMSFHAQSYAARVGRSLEDSVMGVLVQSLVRARTAGVSFSIHPVTRAPSVVINASYGLGESVVSGMVTPDSFEVDKLTEAVAGMLGFKETLMRPAEGGGTEVVDTPPEMSDMFSLESHEVMMVHRMTTHLEDIAGHPVDVEWAIENDTLYCLQMRPISA